MADALLRPGGDYSKGSGLQNLLLVRPHAVIARVRVEILRLDDSP